MYEPESDNWLKRDVEDMDRVMEAARQEREKLLEAARNPPDYVLDDVYKTKPWLSETALRLQEAFDLLEQTHLTALEKACQKATDAFMAGFGMGGNITKDAFARLRPDLVGKFGIFTWGEYKDGKIRMYAMVRPVSAGPVLVDHSGWPVDVPRKD